MPPSTEEDMTMLKYLIAWLLGVPLGVLILIYLFTHLL
jgi:hypothetical protein